MAHFGQQGRPAREQLGRRDRADVGSRGGAQRHRSRAKVESEPPRVRDEGGDIRRRPGAQGLQQRPARGLETTFLGVAEQGADSGPGGARLEPRQLLGRQLSRVVRRRHGDDPDDVLPDPDRNGVGDDLGWLARRLADHGGGVFDDRAHTGLGDGPPRPDDRIPQGGNRDRDRAPECVGRRGRDAEEIVAGDGAGDDRQRGGSGGGVCRPPIARRRGVAVKRAGAFHHDRAWTQ